MAQAELGLISRFLEAKIRRADGGELAFTDWARMRLQAWGRMLPLKAYRRRASLKLLQTVASALLFMLFTGRAFRPPPGYRSNER